VTAGHTFKRPFILGIEGGGTRTNTLLADARGQDIQQAVFSPGNVRLLDDRALVRLLKRIAKQFPKPDAIGLGMAGARNKKDRTRIRTAVAKTWENTPCHVTHDMEIALGPRKNTSVLVLSGTGSCCFGRGNDGRTAKIGGWGHILGDKGSGFEIGLRGLKAVVFYFDRDGTWSRLGKRLLAATTCNEPDDLIDWVAQANKEAIAALAVEVFAAGKQRDLIARDILEGAVSTLAKDAINCAKKLVAKDEKVEFVLAGGVMRNQPAFAKAVSANIRRHWPKTEIIKLNRDGVWGAIELAQKLATGNGEEKISDANITQPLSPTEKRNPRSKDLDKLPIGKAIELMLSEEARGGKAVLAESKKIKHLVGWVAKALKGGGRLFYVGAGTSGRLGVLDASECPPTFRARPEQVQGIIAGGARALTRSIEGAEDDSEAGARAVQFRGVNKKDVVIGIAASGRTPFVWGAMEEADDHGARTALVCFNPHIRRQASVPQLILTPKIGPEVLTGSTRLKAGTATKLILNCITTLAMANLGKVAGNLMTDLDPKNKKLRNRAVRIVQTLTGTDAATALTALMQTDWVVKGALRRLDY
jgi:N-acetylmuramic acid 6-phosphate etherase|tara:strand:- start:2623 stop:4386 length:1764 start_codon:yes stop_codon:yes gene_type:complete